MATDFTGWASSLLEQARASGKTAAELAPEFTTDSSIHQDTIRSVQEALDAPLAASPTDTGTTIAAATTSSGLTRTEYQAMLQSDATQAHGYAWSPQTGRYEYTDPAGDTAGTSLESQAGSIEQSQYDDDVTTEGEYGLPEGTAYTSAEDLVQSQLASQAASLESAELTAGANTQASAVSLQELRLAATTSAAAVAADKATAREGVGSSTGQSISDSFTSRMEDQVASAEQSRNAAQVAQALALTNLEQAHRLQNQGLIERFQQEYDMAYLEAQAADVAWMDSAKAYTDSRTSAQIAQTSAVTSFRSVIDTGVELTTEGIQSFASQLGVDFDVAYAYYKGAENIRNDKTLSVEEKQIANDQAAQDLNDSMTGGALKEQRKIDYFRSQVQSGDYSDADIEALAVLLDIPVAENPVYQSEKALADAGVAYKDSTTAKNYQDLLEAQAVYNEEHGTTGGYIPESDVYTVTQSGNSIVVDVTDGQSLDDPETSRDEGQCGAFVNDVAGTTMGDTLASKLLFTNDAITSPQAGMFFVRPGGYDLDEGDSGHTGMIEWVDLASGEMGVVDVNLNDNGMVSRYTTTITNDMKFGVPVNGTAMSGGDDLARSLAESIMDPTSNAKLSDLTATRKEEVLPMLNELKNEALGNGDFYGVMAASAGGSNPDSTFKTSMAKASTVVSQLELLSQKMVEKGVMDSDSVLWDLSPLSGWLAEKNPWSTDAQEMKAILQGTVPNLARGVFGEVGVLTDHDIELYMKTLPNLQQTDDVKLAVTALTMKVIQDSIENQIGLQAAGGTDMSGYSSYYKALDDQITSIESQLGINDGEGTAVEEIDEDSNLHERALLQEQQDAIWEDAQ